MVVRLVGNGVDRVGIVGGASYGYYQFVGEADDGFAVVADFALLNAELVRAIGFGYIAYTIIDDEFVGATVSAFNK